MADDRVAVITGASSGIGEATARELATHGWHGVLLARRAEELERIAGEIGGEWEVCDVSDRTQVDEVAARVLERHPAIGLLVNNAGIPARGSFLDIDPELVERVTAVNYLGGVWCLRAFAPGLRAARDAHVVNLVSVSGSVAFAPAGAYAAAKHAQLAFSRSTAALLRPEGIHVHTVMPGFVETEGFPQRSKLRSPFMRRFVIEAEDVAEAVVEAVEKNKDEVTVPWFPYRIARIGQVARTRLFSRFVIAPRGRAPRRQLGARHPACGRRTSRPRCRTATPAQAPGCAFAPPRRSPRAGAVPRDPPSRA